MAGQIRGRKADLTCRVYLHLFRWWICPCTGKSCSGSAPVDRFLNIRRLADQVHARLRLRAAHNGRSMEAEARDILDRVCAADYQAPEGSGLRRISQD